MPRTVIITGMGRSGTSLIANLVQRAGVNIGDRLVPAGKSNPRGYFEDVDFFEFHEKLLRDRGQTILVNRDFSFEATTEETQRAQRLIEQHRDQELWGWKDPRTSLFLEFWHQLLPEAYFLFVYRHPLDILLSFVRYREQYNIGLLEGIEAWHTYNTKIKQFYQLHRSQSLLCSTYEAVDQIDTFNELLRTRLGLDSNLSAAVRDSLYQSKELRRTALSEEIDALFRATHPEAVALYEELNLIADLPATPSPPTKTPSTEFTKLLQFVASMPTSLETPHRRALLLYLISSIDGNLIESFFKGHAKDILELEQAKKWLESQWGNWKEAAEHRQIRIEQLQNQLDLAQQITVEKQEEIQAYQEREQLLETQLAQSQERERIQQGTIAELQNYIHQIVSSKSWRLTSFLRMIFGNVIHLRGFITVRAMLIGKKLLPPFVKQFLKQRMGWGNTTAPPGVPTLSDTPPTLFSQPINTPVWDENLPLVSVIIPCYNYGHYVEEAIDSVLNQTLKNLEIIVVNDGSTDTETIRILEKLKKPKTRVLHQANMGLPEARNQGIRQAHSKYICCLDADDTLEPTYLEKAITLLETNLGISFAYSWAKLFGDEEGTWKTESYDLEKLLRYNHISVAAVFARSAWEQVSGYTSDMQQGYEDWEFWIRLGAQGLRGQLIPEALFNHRRHGKNMTDSAREKHQQIFLDITRRHSELFSSPAAVKKIQAHFKDLHVTQPCLNLQKSEFFLQPAKNKPPLLLLVPWLQVGGAETVLYQIMNGLKEDFEFYLFTSMPDKNEWHDRFYSLTPYIYHLPNFLPRYAWEDFLVNFIHARNIQKLFISHSEFGYQALPKLKEKIAHLHTSVLIHNDSDLGYFPHSIKYDHYIDQHIVVNDLINCRLQKTGQINPVKIQTIYNAIDEKIHFNPSQYQRNALRERWQLPLNKKIITFIARMSQEKQPEHFVRMAATLKPHKHLFFVMVGDGWLQQKIQGEIERLGISEAHLRWYKGLPPTQIPELLAISDILALTSTVEGFPMTVLEALAMKVPVVSYDVGEVQSVIQNGVNGFVIPPQQHTLLMQRVFELASNEDMLERFKQEARSSLIKRGFTLERMIAQYRNIWDATNNEKRIIQ
jgi:glycosyltransferase involved in cell wall biosynthesis/GT2 family glycosyltransferase